MNKAVTCVLYILILIPGAIGCCGSDRQDSILRRQIGQMLIVGFRGTELQRDNHIVADIRQLGIGGVILFDYDSPGRTYDRNIAGPEQLKKLNTELQNLTPDKLIIAIDQEGGKVNRLKTRYGFPATVSAQYLGTLDNRDSTERYAAATGATLKELGFNLNFAPCVDVNVNPACPVIGAIGRSFSSDTTVVIAHARRWLDAQQQTGVTGCLKHFPGHGSSTVDTHLGVADVTTTWSEAELAPYRQLIASGGVHVVMTSHIYNANLDDRYPATLSRAILTGILREQLGFEGVIITDDLAMGAMVKNYPFEQILEKAINAGADLLCLSNNGEQYDPQIAQKAVEAIFGLVKSGRIDPQIIEAACGRIERLKERL